MPEAVTAVAELYSVTTIVNYYPGKKIHVVAELHRHGAGRKYLMDVQVFKTSVNGSSISHFLGSCLTNAFGALTAPTRGPDLRFQLNSELVASICDLVWHSSHHGRNSTVITVVGWVSPV